MRPDDRAAPNQGGTEPCCEHCTHGPGKAGHLTTCRLHGPEANDRIYEEDLVAIKSLLFDLAEGLAALGLTGQGDDEIKITVCCFSRLGVPLEVDG